MFGTHAISSVKSTWMARTTKRTARRSATSRLAFRRACFEPLEERIVLNSGMIVQPVGTSAVAMDSFLDATGKLVVTGYANAGSTGEDVAVLRYNLDGATPGTLDTSFGTGGIVTTQVLSGDRALDAAATPDGGIVVVGQSTPGKGSSNAHDSIAVRYNRVGSLDKNFGGTGIVRADLGNLYDYYSSVLVQADGKSVAGGGGGGKLVRYTTTGKLDSTFGTGGIVESTFGATPYAYVMDIALQRDDGQDKIVVGGHVRPNTQEDFALARYDLNGTRDDSFAGGMVFTDIGNADRMAAIAVYPDSSAYTNHIVATGINDSGTFIKLAVARYEPDGALDTTFGNGQGFVTPYLGDIICDGQAVAVEDDGSIIVAGSEAPYVGWGVSRFVLVRLQPNGTPDPGFGAAGKVIMPLGNFRHAEMESVVIQPDGKIIVAGWGSDGSDNPPYYDAPRTIIVARFLPDGRLDPDFGDPLPSPPTPAVSIVDSFTLEGDSGPTTLEFTVSVSAPRRESSVVTVDYAFGGGTATAGIDYAAAAGTLVFNPGETTKTITVSINGDMVPEPDETFFVNLSNAVNATIADNQGIGTILTDEPALAINDVSMLEGNTGTTAFVFTVGVSLPHSTSAVTVNYATVDGTATAGSDYTTASGTLTFNTGVTSQTITVWVNGDTVPEADETFFVILSGAAGATIADAQGVGTILTDEPTLAIDNVSKSEGHRGTTTCTFIVTLNRAASQTVTVDYATANGTAIAGEDYNAIARATLTFAPGATSQTINVSVIGDRKGELDETFSVNLSNAVGAAIADAEGLGTIKNDDGAALMAAFDEHGAAASLSLGQIQQLTPLALALWSAQSHVAMPTDLRVELDDLPSGQLGAAFEHTITLDTNANGAGWYMDRYALSVGQVDLLTVLAHEIGHVLGYDHSDNAFDVMAATLPLATRRLPGPGGLQMAIDTLRPLSIVTSTAVRHAALTQTNASCTSTLLDLAASPELDGWLEPLVTQWLIAASGSSTATGALIDDSLIERPAALEEELLEVLARSDA